jgi:hypothetical protein
MLFNSSVCEDIGVESEERRMEYLYNQGTFVNHNISQENIISNNINNYQIESIGISA